MFHDKKSPAFVPTPVLVTDICGKIFYAGLEDNCCSEEFIKMLSPAVIRLAFSDHEDMGKEADLPWELSFCGGKNLTSAGDIILLSEKKILICFEEKALDFICLAKIGNVTKEELIDAFGRGDETVTFSLEWSE